MPIIFVLIYNKRFLHLFHHTAGVAVLMTIITMLSTPILTCIFGDGSLEVNCQSFIKNTRQSLLSGLNQGEDTEDWAYDEPAVMQVKSLIKVST